MSNRFHRVAAMAIAATLFVSPSLAAGQADSVGSADAGLGLSRQQPAGRAGVREGTSENVQGAEDERRQAGSLRVLGRHADSARKPGSASSDAG